MRSQLAPRYHSTTWWDWPLGVQALDHGREVDGHADPRAETDQRATKHARRPTHSRKAALECRVLGLHLAGRAVHRGSAAVQVADERGALELEAGNQAADRRDRLSPRPVLLRRLANLFDAVAHGLLLNLERLVRALVRARSQERLRWRELSAELCEMRPPRRGPLDPDEKSSAGRSHGAAGADAS